MNVRKEPNATSTKHYKGFRNEADEAVYAFAVSLFEARMRDYADVMACTS